VRPQPVRLKSWRSGALFSPPVPEVSPIYGFTVPIAGEWESSIFKNLGNSHTTRTAIIASIRKISIVVSFLCFPISSSFISFFELTQPPIRNGIDAFIFRMITGLQFISIRAKTEIFDSETGAVFENSVSKLKIK